MTRGKAILLAGLVLIAGVMVIVFVSGGGRETPENDRQLVQTALKALEYPKDSVVQYCFLPADSRWPACKLNNQKEVVFESDGYVLFIDEQPACDWAHSMQIIFIPSDAPEGPRVLFRGEAIPGLGFVGPDGKKISGWKKY